MLLAQDHQFKDAYSAFEDRLFRIAKRLLISEDEAKDATQEVVIKLWQMSKKQRQQLKSLEAYAVTMTKNYCFDRLKSKHAQQDFLDDSFIQKADSDSLNKQLDRSDALQWVGKLMDGLPEKERLILQLRDIENYEFDEIAKVLTMPETTVRVYLSRARRKIKEKFKKVDGHGL